MRARASLPSLSLALVLAFGTTSRAAMLTFDIPPGQGPLPNFLFDPTLGTLNSLWLEWEYSTVAVYSNFSHSAPLGPVSVYVTWFGKTTFTVGGSTGYRQFSFDWDAHAWGNNGPSYVESFMVQGSTGSQSRTYSGSDIPDFFISRGDEDFSLVTLTESPNGWPQVTPEAAQDRNGNYWVIDMAGMNLEVLRVNYLYNTPEPSTLILLGMGVLGCAVGFHRRTPAQILRSSKMFLGRHGWTGTNGIQMRRR